jgi:DNA-binding transcriptional MerR regulator
VDIKGPVLPDQDFFTMGEVCRLVQVPAHTLRYWEARVGLLRPARRAGGHRRYSRADIETIVAIREFVLRRKMTVAGARKALIERRKARPAPAAAAPEPQGGAPAGTLKVLREVRKEIRTLMDELSK